MCTLIVIKVALNKSIYQIYTCKWLQSSKPPLLLSCIFSVFLKQFLEKGFTHKSQLFVKGIGILEFSYLLTAQWVTSCFMIDYHPIGYTHVHLQHNLPLQNRYKSNLLLLCYANVDDANDANIFCWILPLPHMAISLVFEFCSCTIHVCPPWQLTHV